MDNIVYGKTEGIKKRVLEQLQSLYDLHLDQGQLISEELALLLRDISESIGREVSVYVDRKGIISSVSVGSDHAVSLQDTGSRRSLWRLSGITAIHTHPSGTSRLSGVDISTLKNLRLDGMAALAWKDAEAMPLLSLGLITDLTDDGVPVAEEFGPYSAKEAARIPYGTLLQTIERILGKKTRSEKTGKEVERAMLVSLHWGEDCSRYCVEDSVEELAQLAETAGAIVAAKFVQSRPKPDPVFFIGKGKVEEMALFAQQEDIDLCLVDDDLSPAQQRNLEQALGVRIIDRTGLILDIFAKRARTSEGKLQVELAQLQYLLPRIMGQGASLSRLGGGIGTRGPGETKLEVDRRRIRDRIGFLEAQIEKMKGARRTQQKAREKSRIKQVCLVGYTNAGKSSLLNALTHSEIYAENQLFATLDPTTRQLSLPNKEVCTLTDTVGFIQRLPHQLVAAFRSTLEVVKGADLLLHVIDVSHELHEKQEEAVLSVLKELGVTDTPILTVYNKIDKLPDHEGLKKRLDREESLAISARSGEGIPALIKKIASFLNEGKTEVTLLIPYTETKLSAQLHEKATVLSESYGEKRALMKVRLDKHDVKHYAPYLKEET